MNSDLVECVNTNIEISIVANHFVEKYLNKGLCKCFGKENKNAVVTNIPYEVFSDVEYELHIKTSEVVVVWLDFEFLFPRGKNLASLLKAEVNIIWELLKYMYDFFIEKNVKQLIWVTFDKYNNSVWRYCGCLLTEENPIDELNYRLMKHLKKATIIDIDHVIAMDGIENAYSLNHAELWNIKFSENVMEHLSSEIYKQYNVFHGKTLKCIVTDCDNTLWEGTVLEDGIDNISCGGIYRSYQQALLNLYQRGIILCIASKNDIDDIDIVLNQNRKMIVNRSHFACVEANWDDKVINIQKISETLNIGLNSILFVDDSLFEIQNVKQRIPEVNVCIFDGMILSNLSLFNLHMSVDSENINIRHMSYRDNVKRAEAKKQTKSYEDYLKLLDSKVLIEFATKEDIDRISDLSQRTNKLTNGIRFTTLELSKRMEQNSVYKVTLSDVFGDLGVVGAMSVCKQESGNVLDLFCLSCRALGRNIENQMAKFIKNEEKIDRICFSNTGKNRTVKSILGEIGELMEDGIVITERKNVYNCRRT